VARSIAENNPHAVPAAGNDAGLMVGARRENPPRWAAIPRPTAFPGQDVAACAEAIEEPPKRVPWTPLTTITRAHRFDAGSPGTSDPQQPRIELHVVPTVAPASLIMPTLLIDAGRQAGLFPQSATVTLQESGGLVSALLADPAAGDPEMATAGCGSSRMVSAVRG
jgi:hypothetical protein